MADQCTCECQASDVLIFPCSGGSNVGQITNSAGVQLVRENLGRLFCLAGVGGHVESMLNSARGAAKIVAIDGCGVACARKTLEHAGVAPSVYAVVTELGIKKTHDLDSPRDDVERVCNRVKALLSLV